MSKSILISQASHMYPFSAPLTWRDSETSFAGMAQYPLISEIDYKPSDQNQMLTALGGGGGDLSSICQTARRYESGDKDSDRQYTNSMKAPMPTMYNSRNDENGFGVFDRASQSVNLSSNAQQQEAINHSQLFDDHNHVPSQMIAEENVKPTVSSLPCSSSPDRVPGGQMNQIANQVHNQSELRCGAFVKAGADEGPYVVQVRSSSSSPLDMLLSADRSAAQNAILSHPLYPYLVATHIDCCKLGAEPADLKILGEALSNYQNLQPPNNSIPSDGTIPDLDNVMAWYLRMLVDLKKSIEEPFFREMEWCNEIFAKVKLLGPSSSPTEMTEGQSRAGDKEGFASTVGETPQPSYAPPFDHKKALATELMKEDKMIKDWLKTKHDRSEIYSLRGQCSKKRRQGKHPETARECLLEWFNVHGDWPYPSEEEKLRLARLTKLEARQINNWFINQRKRHWESPIKDETIRDVQEELKSQRQFANIDKVLLDRFRVPSDALNNSSYSWSSTFT